MKKVCEIRFIEKSVKFHEFRCIKMSRKLFFINTVNPSKSGRNCAKGLIIEIKFGSEKELTFESELKK